MSIVPTDNLRSQGRLSKLGVFIAGFVTAVLLLVALSHPAPPGFSGWLRNTLQLGMDQPAIVQRIQRLQRLESVKYTLEKVVTGERQSRFLPQSLAGERLLTDPQRIDGPPTSVGGPCRFQASSESRQCGLRLAHLQRIYRTGHEIIEGALLEVRSDAHSQATRTAHVHP